MNKSIYFSYGNTGHEKNCRCSNCKKNLTQTCSVIDLATGTPIKTFIAESECNAESKALNFVKKTSWQEVCFNPRNSQVSWISNVTLRQVLTHNPETFKDFLAKKLAGNLHKRLSNISYTLTDSNEGMIGILVKATISAPNK